MNSNKKAKTLAIVVIAIIVIVAIVWSGKKGGDSNPPFEANGSSTPVAVSETTKVSGSLSEYQNAELGFSVKYPSAWEKEDINSGVNFSILVDKEQVSTVASLQANIQVIPGTCVSWPAVSVKDKSSMTVDKNTFSMILMSNTVKNYTYFNRMYSLQSDGICYMFIFAAVNASPTSKGMKGSQVTQAENNNKAIVNTADKNFTDMVKSFAYITLPAGKDETKMAPTK